MSGLQVTVSADDLSAVLQAVDYVSNPSLSGPVDRLGDALALVCPREANGLVFKKGDRVEVAQITQEEYHYAPVGAVGTVTRIDTAGLPYVKFDGPLVSIRGKEHPEGFGQWVPLADLKKIPTNA